MKPQVTGTEPLTGWERFKQQAREALEAGKAKHQRAEDLRRELNPLDLQTIRWRLNLIEGELIEILDRKGKLDWGEGAALDSRIQELMDDWHTVQAIIEARTR